MNHTNKKVLVAIFHKPGKHDENFENLKIVFKDFDIFIPTIDFYGNKWSETKNYWRTGNYDALFIICSDVRIVCGDVTTKIIDLSNDVKVGVYGFGTVGHCTFNWLRFDNQSTEKIVPFIEGYCIGINKALLEKVTHSNTYGYGLDIESGYKAHINNLKCVLNNEICISHPPGKSYDDLAATHEYLKFLSANPSIYKFLKDLNIATPI